MLTAHLTHSYLCAFPDDFINNTVFLPLIGRHDVVALGVVLDTLHRLPGVSHGGPRELDAQKILPARMFCHICGTPSSLMIDSYERREKMLASAIERRICGGRKKWRDPYERSEVDTIVRTLNVWPFHVVTGGAMTSVKRNRGVGA